VFAVQIFSRATPPFEGEQQRRLEDARRCSFLNNSKRANTPNERELYLGLDVHEDWTAVADKGRNEEVRQSGPLRNKLREAEKRVGKLRQADGKEVILRACERHPRGRRYNFALPTN
jgi:hypothetical protein